MNSSISSSNTLPAGCLWALFLIAAFEACVALIPPYVYDTRPYEMSMLREKERLASRGGSYDIVILGSSFAWASIKPDLIRSELKKSSFNFSTNLAQTYLLSYVFLERYFSAAGKRPELVLIEVSPWALTYDPRLDFDYYNRYLMPIVGAQPDVLRELPEGVAMNAVARALSPPSIKMQYFLQKHGWPLKLLRADKGDYARIMSLFRGGEGYFDESWDPGKRPVEVVTDISEDVVAFRPSSLNTRYLGKMLDLCESRGIPVVLCSLAVREDARRIWEKHDVGKKMEEYIAGLSSRYPCIRGFMNMTDAVPDKTRYADDYHLNDEGATLYTLALCGMLRKIPATPGKSD